MVGFGGVVFETTPLGGAVVGGGIFERDAKGGVVCRGVGF
jgi:hypothetical protein